MNVTLWDSSSDVRKELSIQDDRTESDNRIEVTLLIGITEINLPHIARWESTKPPYAEPHVRWCGRSVNVKIGGKCLLWLAFTSYPIFSFHIAYSIFLYGWRGVKSGWRDKENSSPPETPINRGVTGEKVKSEEINRDCLQLIELGESLHAVFVVDNATVFYVSLW